MPDTPVIDIVHWVDEDAGDGFGPAGARADRIRRQAIKTGTAALVEASDALAAGVDQVADALIGALEGRLAQRAAASPSGEWEVDQIDVSFGVQLVGGATIAVFQASTEASAQVSLSFRRRPPTHPVE